jgi:hypothetical protein
MMLAAFIAYVPLLLLSMALVDAQQDAWWRYPAALLPMAPFVYGAFAVLWLIRNEDELKVRVTLEALSIAFGATARRS